MKVFYHIGSYFIMLGQMLTQPENYKVYLTELFRQMNLIGVGSLIIVSIISFFVGAVTAVQFAFQLDSGFFPKYLLGFIVRDTMLIELAPTLSCLVLAGKVGSNMSSELGSMRLSSQIDALEVMGINGLSYLVLTKIVAAIIIVPPLIIYSTLLGCIGGMFGTVNYGISPTSYYQGLLYVFNGFNVFIMLCKAVVFAFLVASVPCYQGYHVQGGALEIGKANTRAVVYSSILIILFDYLLAFILT
ncbi:MAG: ABC transporter permease [Sphingobacteriales bacterium]|jgi:phospholipid/cholesterol/gamma-HCH transport system permease protein|nr:ABC transporter permease [Sphingobacteriales bacterium]MBP9142404.1 ABC transporter permease [Chitinophagales bacterium]MDA0199975.1 ABC transporter permease [Bacteroidota bacterium]MBK6889702.1 ABC transporter permease [Sphingobacteriales bacterium]MBK7527784.1 ABC transporter permease [Sphingobacteriales bacterium]